MTKEVLKLAEQSIKDLIYALAEGRITGDDYQPVELEAFSVLDAIKEALAQPAPPPECKTEAEQTAYAFGWWKALESVRTEQPAQEPNQASYPEYDRGFSEGWDRCKAAAQPEPVAWLELLREAKDNCKASIVEEGISASRKEYRIELEARLTAALNASPPKRPWVGLTDEEASWCQAPSTIQTWKRIEAKLKEKNT